MLNMIIKFSPTWRGGVAYLKQAKNSPFAGSGGPLASALGNVDSAPTITSAQKLVRRCDISRFRFFIHLLPLIVLGFSDLGSSHRYCPKSDPRLRGKLGAFRKRALVRLGHL